MKHLKVLCSILFFACMSHSYAQCDYVPLNNQNDVDTFVASFSNTCTSIGTLHIKGNVDLSGLTFVTELNALVVSTTGVVNSFQGLDNVTQIPVFNNYGTINSLQGLGSVTLINEFYIGGSFYSFSGLGPAAIGEIEIVSPSLTSFSGLDNVVSIDDIYIGSNSYVGLSNFQGFPSHLTQLNSIEFQGNNNVLTSFQGLENITSPLKIQLNFQSSLPSLTSFQGLTNVPSLDLRLLGGDIGATDFTGLENLTSLKAILYNWSSLTSFTGLSSLTELDLQIEDCDNFNNFTGLSTITAIDKIQIEDCMGFSSFQGLENVTSIDEIDIFISSSSVNHTTSFQGLENVTSMNILKIRNSDINSLNSLQNLSSTTMEYIELGGPGISSFANVFTSLQHVTSDLRLSGLSDLPDLDGFNNLQTVGGTFRIMGNPLLTAFSGLSSLTSIGFLEVRFNYALNDCCIFLPFVNGAIPTNTEISNNALNCFSEESLVSTCGSYVDTDGDGIINFDDNCPDIANPGQEDQDNDGIGDVCDDDIDGDGDLNDADNCPNTANSNQADQDGDGIGDVCDDDRDGDGILNVNDNCTTTPNADQADFDNDGRGDVCDSDMDGDGVWNDNDNCPTVPNNNQVDANNDGIGDSCNDQSGVGTGTFGVGTTMPSSKLHVSQGDVYIDNLNRGIIMKAPNGKCFRYRPKSNGTLEAKEITCPN